MLSIAQLRTEHDVLLALADEIERAAAGDEPFCLSPLIILWERFNQLLDIHLLREDGVLYPAILEGTDPEAARIALCFQRELGSLEGHADAFAQKWTEGAVRRNWKAFSTEIGSFLAELRVRIERENEELYPLLEADEVSCGQPIDVVLFSETA